MNQSRPEFFLQWNTSSLVLHWGEFKNYILHNKPLVAAIQETRFLDSDSINYIYNINDYSLYTNNVNDLPRRGGSALYISNNILHHQIQLRTTLNVVGVKAKIAQRDLTILSIYLSPAHTFNPTHLSELLSQLSPPPFIVMGDYNAHHLTWGCQRNDTRGTQLLNVIQTLDLALITSRIPTHNHLRDGVITHSVIDFAITDTNTATLFTQYTADDPLFSDHYPLHYSLDVPSGQTNFSFLPRFNFKKADWASFQEHINVNITTPPPDINSFLDIILESAREHIPLTKPPHPTKNAPWWNNECQRAVALRRRALRQFRACLCSDHEEAARKARTESRKIILQAKKSGWQTFSNTFNRFTPLSKIWSLLKCFNKNNPRQRKIPHLHINNVDYLTPLDVANQFALHYAHISSTQQYTSQQNTTLDTQLNMLSFHSTNTEMYNSLFSMNELRTALGKCGNTSVGPDQIAYQFLKNLPESGLVTLLACLNQLWENNSYPSSWRESTIIPILKPSKLPSDPSSYRPISLTSCASKLLERMVNGRIRAYLESNHLLNEHQNGFRPGRSTTDSIVPLIDTVQRGLRERHFTVAVFIDFKNAFDRVHKSGLLIKLHRMGIRGRMASFIKNFLKDRTINVRCGNTTSPSLKQDHGLPQGSVISPTLFLIMINDIFANTSEHIKYSLYADDVAFWCKHKSLDQAITTLQIALTQVEEWCNKWGLTVSTSKTVAVIFSKRLKIHNHNNLIIYNKPIKYVSHFKYLGITIDKHLNFNEHFQDITQRCARRLNIMRCIAGREWGADRRTLLRIYTALIRPILDYNGFLYDDIASSQIDSLQQIQNNALRIITGAMRTTPIKNLHIEVNIPNLDRRRKYLLIRYFIRCAARPQCVPYSILSQKHDGLRSGIQLRNPLIGERLQRTLRHFQLDLPDILPSPPLTAFFLEQVQNVEFLFTENKQHVTQQETKQLFYKYEALHKEYTFIYTDGSVMDGKAGAGIYTKEYKKIQPPA